MRCLHESQLYKQNCFITLTYEDKQLPEHGSLKYSDFQRFMKRLRKHTGLNRVRFYMCGEYGSETQRPHYHACIFGYDFPDKKPWRKTGSGSQSYRSASLERLWTHGNSEIGDVTFESAAYVARYCVQKVTGKNAKAHYGERTPEFNKMSLKPGIGANWFELWKKDVYPHDYVVIRGKETKPPKYYDKLLKRIDPDALEMIKENRELDGYRHHQDNSPDRLEVKRIVTQARVKQLIRQEI